jgi:hypothetical protein
MEFELLHLVAQKVLFVFLIMVPKSNARLANKHLIAICNSKHLKQGGGYEQLMSYKVQEIKKFETAGYLLNIPGKETVRVLGTLTQYTADNLGMEEAFGIYTSFNYDGCVTLSETTCVVFSVKTN